MQLEWITDFSLLVVPRDSDLLTPQFPNFHIVWNKYWLINVLRFKKLKIIEITKQKNVMECPYLKKISFEKINQLVIDDVECD